MASLFVAPVSIEVLDASLRVGVAGLLCSTSQVPKSGVGYGGIDYALLRAMHGGRSDVTVERDHLRVHAMSNEESIDWLEQDARHGFTGVMIHTHANDSLGAQMATEATSRGLAVQLGPGEDESEVTNQQAILTAHQAKHCAFISWPICTYVDNTSNRGQFVPPIMQPSNVDFRAHNCDYLSLAQLRHVAQYVSGVNVAPQLGSIQSATYLQIAMSEGLPIDDWVAACVTDDKNAARWCPERPELRVIACGHYHYDKIAWRGSVYDRVIQLLMSKLLLLKGAVQ